MTTTPPSAPPESGPRVSSREVRELGRLRRSTTDRKVAGVAGGLGRHLDIDPTVLRVAFVVLTLFGGAGALLYGACWLFVPEDGAEKASIDLDSGARTVVLVGAAVFAGLLLVGDSWGVVGFPWPLALIGLVVLAFVLKGDRERDRVRDGDPAVSLTKPVPPGAAAPTYGPPPPAPAVRRTARQRRSDRGPGLFLATVALIALGLGTLGMFDVGGVAVSEAAYPATALAVSGLMLVIGAWFGRAGGVVLLGIVAAIALAGANLTADGVGRQIDQTPASAAEVEDSYQVGVGEILLDLSAVDDVDALDGRDLDVDAGAGNIEIVVPDGMDVSVTGEIGAGGELVVFDTQRNGTDLSLRGFNDGGVGAPSLSIDVTAGIGRVEVSRP